MSNMLPFCERAATRPLLLGMVHLAPLPGSPLHDGSPLERIAERARADAEAIVEGGMDGYVVENFGDAPFFPRAVPAHVLTAMTRIILALPRAGCLVGVNVLRNDARGALSIAAAVDADLIRVNVHCGAMVTDQGVLEGEAAETMRLRRAIAPRTAVLADVAVKHALPLGVGFDLAAAAKDTADRGLADGIIVTGSATGAPTAPEDLARVRSAIPERPVLVGSGVDVGTIQGLLRQAHGVIVGTSLKRDGAVRSPVDLARVRRLVAEARAT